MEQILWPEIRIGNRKSQAHRSARRHELSVRLRQHERNTVPDRRATPAMDCLP